MNLKFIHFLISAPKSISYEKRSAFNALRSNPPFPILSNDEGENVGFDENSGEYESLINRISRDGHSKQYL